MAKRQESPRGASAPSSDSAARLATQRGAYLAILQAAEALQRQFAELLKTHDLSLAQYNVLRVLRGAGAAGLACGQVAGRLIRHDPDLTRLLDRLERRKLIERTREPRDRRVVRTHLTAAGDALLAELDGPVEALHERQFGHIDGPKLVALTALLEEARARV